MEIRMKTLMAGPHGSRHPGEKCTVSAEEAEMLINAGYAEPSDDGKKADEAEVEKIEQAEPYDDGKKADEAEVEKIEQAEPYDDGKKAGKKK